MINFNEINEKVFNKDELNNYKIEELWEKIVEISPEVKLINYANNNVKAYSKPKRFYVEIDKSVNQNLKSYLIILKENIQKKLPQSNIESITYDYKRLEPIIIIHTQDNQVEYYDLKLNRVYF